MRSLGFRIQGSVPGSEPKGIDRRSADGRPAVGQRHPVWGKTWTMNTEHLTENS